MEVMGRSRRDITRLKGLQTLIMQEIAAAVFSPCVILQDWGCLLGLSEEKRVLPCPDNLQALASDCKRYVNREVGSLLTVRISSGTASLL